MKVVLTIAGSDSGGGAGIQADLKTFHRFRTFGTSVITAITAQNTVGVRQWREVDLALVGAQLDAVAEDLRPAAVKSGMLGTTGVIQVVADGLRRHALEPYVLDPVMVATSGDPLLERSAIDAVAQLLIPLATLVTPNTYEAAILTGRPVATLREMRDAAKELVEERGATAALVKGGHIQGERMMDVLFDGEFREFMHPRVQTVHTHGTGCTLSAAIAAALAGGAPLRTGVGIALDFVHRAILLAPGLGSGHGPLNHFA